MFRRILAATFIVAIAAALLVAAWPQLFSLEQAAGVAQVVSLRGLAAATAFVAVVALTLISLLSVRLRRFAASLAIVALAFSALTLAVLSTRGFGSPGFETKAEGDVTVLSWNTLGDAPGAATIAELALLNDADVVALPETIRELGFEIAQLMADSGRPMWVHTVAYDQVSKARSTTILISTDLGEYTVDESARTTMTLPSLVAVPQNGEGPTFVAVHAVAPIQGEMTNWRSDLEWLAEQCRTSNTILAGDFNSTLDHYATLADGGDFALGSCVDAASVTDNAAVGTWPTQLPSLLGAPIDHIMASAEWAVTGMRVIESHDGDGSDHRPIVATLTPTQ
ncbi:Xaa-Pro aminopeptidase [Leifsonia rubra CMS 76R]|nr:Xaa-Pro aminopeptidase [Leifsonia rubra CMS 76R]